jgi:hypothetical protein
MPCSMSSSAVDKIVRHVIHLYETRFGVCSLLFPSPLPRLRRESRSSTRCVSSMVGSRATERASLCQTGNQGFNIEASVYRPIVCSS